MTETPERLWLGLEPDECGEPIVQNYVDASEDKSKFTEYIRKDVAAPKVRALEWEGTSAETSIGEYRLMYKHLGDAGLKCSAFLDVERISDWFCDDDPAWEKKAKAAAQADFEARILAALEASPHVNETPKSEHVPGDVLTPATKGERDD